MAFFLSVNFCSAQNLIPNPGFEEVHACPTGVRQLELAKHWFGANAGTPELFHGCGYTSNIPSNSGEGYAGVIFLSEHSSFVEYVQIELTDTLEKGEKYDFSFFIRLSSYSLIAMNKIGVFLSRNGLHKNIWTQFKNRPQIVFNEVVENSNVWKELKGTYVAKGGEQYITVGNFFEKYYITEKVVNTAATDRTSYYYVDDFYLGKSSTITSISAPPIESTSWTHTVYFEKDSALISEKELLLLDEFITQLPVPFFYPIKVEGHTDRDASVEYNLQLSQNRANAVQERMINFKLQNVYTSWAGESSAVYDGENELGMAKNRRVTITVER